MRKASVSEVIESKSLLKVDYRIDRFSDTSLVMTGMRVCEKTVQSMRSQLGVQMGRCVRVRTVIGMRVIIDGWVSLREMALVVVT